MCTLTNGGSQMLTFISEENLYRIVFRSTKPEALNFQNWVFAEVLPTIRRLGVLQQDRPLMRNLTAFAYTRKVSKDKGTFHSLGMHCRKHEKHLNAKRIQTCKENLQIAFKGFNND